MHEISLCEREQRKPWGTAVAHKYETDFGMNYEQIAYYKLTDKIINFTVKQWNLTKIKIDGSEFAKK